MNPITEWTDAFDDPTLGRSVLGQKDEDEDQAPGR